MTYCVAIKTDSGLVFASDSLTNAGIDHVSTYSKMHTFVQPGDRTFVLLAAGNLATTQSVVKRLRDDCRLGNQPCLSNVYSMSDAVDYVGTVSTEMQRTQSARDTANTNFEATFIFGGQIAGHAPEIYMIYPQGNHIHESAAHPFLQIGETKYGKPILPTTAPSARPGTKACARPSTACPRSNGKTSRSPCRWWLPAAAGKCRGSEGWKRKPACESSLTTCDASRHPDRAVRRRA
ncbi:MAG: proteasome subunit [Proteobacteria bacterium]|nr:proteasome subunit [Pseudomonadota bacterium]